MLGSLVREMELPHLKVGVVHGVQLVGGLAGQRRHVLVHVRQGGPDVGRRPAPVAFVIQSDTLCKKRASVRSSLFITVFFSHTTRTTSTAARSIFPVLLNFSDGPYHIDNDSCQYYTC